MFAAKTAGAEDGVDVFTLDEERVELLRQVFWDVCEITTATQPVDIPDNNPDDDVDDSHTGIALTITITAKTAEQMRLIYAFTKYQNDALDILLENLGSLNIPMGSLTISQEDAIALLENLPDDLDPAPLGRFNRSHRGRQRLHRHGTPVRIRLFGFRRLDILQRHHWQLLSGARRRSCHPAQLLREYLMERRAAGRFGVLSGRFPRRHRRQ